MVTTDSIVFKAMLGDFPHKCSGKLLTFFTELMDFGSVVSLLILSIMPIHSHFEARKDDVTLHKRLKTGTTASWRRWLGGRGSSIARIDPRACVQHLEGKLSRYDFPYRFLPDSIKNSECKRHSSISMWHFCNKIMRPNQPPFSLEKAKSAFFRLVVVVDDRRNCLAPEICESLDRLAGMTFEGTGLRLPDKN